MSIREVGTGRFGGSGTMDLSPLIDQNINAGSLLSMPPGIGNDVNGYNAGLSATHDSHKLPVYGQWFKVEDTSVAVDLGMISNEYTWLLANGSSIKLASDEFQGQAPWIHWRDTNLCFDNVYIKLTPNTLPGFRYLGIVGDLPGQIPESQADTVIAEGKKNQQPSLTDKVLGTVKGSTTAAAVGIGSLAVITLVAAAFWFLPRGARK